MKKISLFLIVILIFAFACNNKENNSENNQSKKDKHKIIDESKLAPNHITLYYFHTSRRCKSCVDAEDFIEACVDKNYQNQMNDKTLDYTPVNLETDYGKKLGKKFDMVFNGLIINKFKNKKEEFILAEDLFGIVNEGDEATCIYLRDLIDKELSSLSK